MIRIHLLAAEAERLDTLFRSTEDRKLRDLKGSLRASLCYFQTMRHKVKSIIEGRPKRKSNK